MIPTMDGTANRVGLLDQNDNVAQGGMSAVSQLTMGQQNLYQSSRQDFMTPSAAHQHSFYTSAGGQYRGGGGLHCSDLLYQKQANLALFNTWDTNKLYLDEVILPLPALFEYDRKRPRVNSFHNR